MTPLHERDTIRWRWRTEDDRGGTDDPLSLPPDDAPASGEARRPAPTPQRIFRTVCVRLCDGYYFPISSSVSRGNFAKDERVCQSQCGSEARLYVQRTARSGVEDLKDLKDLQGRSYSQLKTAFLYRSEYLPNCKCRPHPWETEAVQRHQVYSLTAAAAKGDENAAVQLLALQNASEQPGEEGKAEQSERSSDRAVPTREAAEAQIPSHIEERRAPARTPLAGDDLSEHQLSWSAGSLRLQVWSIGLPRVTAEALDALAGFLQLRRRGGVGDAEERAHGEGCAVHAGDALLLEQGQREILVRR